MRCIRNATVWVEAKRKGEAFEIEYTLSLRVRKPSVAVLALPAEARRRLRLVKVKKIDETTIEADVVAIEAPK